MPTQSRWFLPLMAASGVTMSLTAPLEVLFAREFSHSSTYIGVFMLSAGVGVIVIDVFGTRFVPSLDARIALIAGLSVFGLACIGMGVASEGVLLTASRVLQGFGGGLVLGGGLQAAVRVDPTTDNLARSLGRFNAAFLFGGAIGSPGGLLVAGIIDGRVGYQAAFIATGALAVLTAARSGRRAAFFATGGMAALVSAVLAVRLPNMAGPDGMPPPRLGLPRFV